MIKSFRGQLKHGQQERIRLSTNDGLTGYKMVKFQVLPQDPTGENIENVTKVYTKDQLISGGPGVTDTIDFRDPLLLAASFYKGANITNYSTDNVIIFDNMTVNQDIFVTTQGDTVDDELINYYIELQQVKLSHDEAAVATLKDMRAGPDTNFGP